MKQYLLILFSIALISCTNEKANYNNFLNKQLKKNYQLSDLKKYSNIIIMPRKGCNACIVGAEFFFEENKTNKNYLFIFTRLESEKKLIIDIGKENLQLNNVITDKKNLFYSIDYIDSEYPLMLTKDKDENFKYELLNH